VLRTGDGTVGLKPAFLVLTSRRIIIVRMGTTKYSQPKIAEISLEHVMSVNCESGLMTAPPTLTIESRSGTFAVNLVRAARKEASRPGWILEAQGAAQPKASSSDDIASRLAQLATLRDSGALTPKEFAAAKSRILG
jgi:hypothetical protein